MSNIHKRLVILLWIGMLCHAGVGLASTNAEPVNAQASAMEGGESTNSDPANVQASDFEEMASTNSEPASAEATDPEWINRGKSEAEGEDQSDEAVDLGGSAWRSIGALLFIVGALVIVQIMLKRRAAGHGFSDSQELKTVSRLRIGPRQELVIVEWEGEQLMLGVSQSAIQPLHRHPCDSAEQASFEEKLHEL